MQKSLKYASYVKELFPDLSKCKSVCGKYFVHSDMTTTSKLFYIKYNQNDFPEE